MQRLLQVLPFYACVPRHISLFAFLHEYSGKWTGLLVICKDTVPTAEIVKSSVNKRLPDWIHQGEPRTLYPGVTAH